MRADRLVSIILLLQTRGKLTAHELADELEVSRRTILRDIDALSVAGVPVYADGGHHGGIALDENYRTTLTGLKETELYTLFVSGNTSLLADIGLGAAAESTHLKLAASMPLHHQSAIEEMQQRIYIDPVGWWHENEPMAFWAELQQGVFEDRKIRAVYEHYDGEVVERVLEPFSLVAKASVWYLVARRDGQTRTYRVARFHHITLLDEHFQRPADFDLAAHWQRSAEAFLASSPGFKFTLRLPEDRLVFARRLTMCSHEIIEPPDEDGWLVARLHAESLDMAAMIVFGLGGETQVIEPPELHALVVRQARNILVNELHPEVVR
jgi:predicted DNA-binding transcriptional regulator YafY